MDPPERPPAPKYTRGRSKPKGAIDAEDSERENPSKSTNEEHETLTYEPPPGFQGSRQNQKSDDVRNLKKNKKSLDRGIETDNAQPVDILPLAQKQQIFTERPPLEKRNESTEEEMLSQDKVNKGVSFSGEGQPPQGFNSCRCGIRNGPEPFASQEYQDSRFEDSDNRRYERRGNGGEDIDNEMMNNPRLNIPNYLAENNCDMNIILGRREKDQVKFIGQQLLLMGKRVLNEINFVGSFLGEEETRCTSDQTPYCNFEPGCQCNQCQSPQRTNHCSRMEDSVQTEDGSLDFKAAENWICELERNKKEFIEAFGKICYSIGQAKESQPKGMPMYKGGHGGPQSNRHRSDKPLSKKMYAPSSASTCAPGDMGCFLGLTRHNSEKPGRNQSVSTCFDGEDGCFMGLTRQNSNVGNDDCTEVEKFHQLADRLTLLETKFTELDDQVGELINTVLKQNTGMTCKIAHMENDMLHMAKFIHELQCVTKLQMHLGTTGTEQ